VQLVWVVVITGKPEIVFVVKPYLEFGLPAGYTDPLSNVELLLLYYHRRLNILLRYPNFIQAVANVIYQVVFLTVNLNSSASRLPSWFNDPSVFGAIQSKLKWPNCVL
jgi:hypothetical protein